MEKSFKIGDTRIDKVNPVYIIAEAGVNHNGKLDLALKLIDEAKRIGADCIKFQTFKADNIVTKDAPKADYQLKVTNKSESQYEMLKKLELDFHQYKKIIAYCNEVGIQFLSTPYNKEDADFLYDLGVDAFKIASGQLVETPFLSHVAKFKKPVLLSTGMGTLSEVYQGVQAIRKEGNDKVIVLQCTTNYPATNEDANIRAMRSMGKALNTLYGYSDHIPSNYACYTAVALGASLVEKHFTLDRELSGPDHSSSLDPFGFEELVKGIRAVERALGSPVKQPTEAEEKNIKGMRRSIVLLKSLSKGEIIKEEDICFKRPATGITPDEQFKIVGKKTRKSIPANTPLNYNMIEW